MVISPEGGQQAEGHLSVDASFVLRAGGQGVLKGDSRQSVIIPRGAGGQGALRRKGRQRVIIPEGGRWSVSP